MSELRGEGSTGGGVVTDSVGVERSSPPSFDRKAVAALHRQVATVAQFDVVARRPAEVEQWLGANYGPGYLAEFTGQVRSYHRPFGRGARVFSGVDRKDGVLWIVRQSARGEWETVWPPGRLETR